MKLLKQKATTVIILSALILIMGCNKISSEKKLHILHFENSAGEKGKTTLNYDESGLNIGAKWELLNGSRWSENYHTYDTNGNFVLKYREFSDSLTSYTWYTYNENNLLIKEKFFRSDSIQGIAYYNYDENGRLLSMDCQGLNGWFYGFIEMNYDQKGIKKGANIKKDTAKIGHIDYEYKNDLLVKEYWEFNQGYNQTFTYEYETYEKPKRKTYTSSNVYITNTHNYKVVLEEYDYNNQGGGPSYFEYNEKAKLLKKTFVRADGLATISNFYYNENGILTNVIRVYNSGEEADFIFTYNGNRRLIEKSFTLPTNIQGYEKYEYNDKMQLQKAELKNFDKWITGIIGFEYDENGNIKIGHFTGDKFKAEIYFTFDENNNVINYIWDFSFGEKQSYHFTYEELN